MRLAPFALALCALGLRRSARRPPSRSTTRSSSKWGGPRRRSSRSATSGPSAASRPGSASGRRPSLAPRARARDVPLRRRARPVRGGRRGRLRLFEAEEQETAVARLAGRDVRLPARPRGRPARPPRRVHADVDSGRRDHAVGRPRRRRELRPAARAPLIGAGAQRFRLDLVSTNFHRRRVTKGSPLPSAYFFPSPCRSTGYT